MVKIRLLLFGILGLLPLEIIGKECRNCHQEIRGRYIESAGREYCSQRCFLETLPECSACGEPCRQMYTVQNRKFCSKRCLRQIFRCDVCRAGLENIVMISNTFGREKMCCQHCRSLPQCYYCAMPDNHPALPDGRYICRDCRRSAVIDRQEIRRIFDRLRSELAQIYGYDKNHHIELHVVDLRELQQLSASEPQPGQMGLMCYHKKEHIRRDERGENRVVIEEKCRIYVLSSMPRALLINTLVHELTHDYIRHNIGDVRDKVSEEGFCELIASLFNQRIGNDILNRSKEASADPVYGGGYRKMRTIYHRNNRSFQRTLRFVR